ncbi:hypothetical protein ACSTHY_00065, partial [Vibrio parahaemolyticus]
LPRTDLPQREACGPEIANPLPMAPRKEPSPYSLAPFGGFSRRGVYGRPWGTFFSDLWHEIVDHRVIDGAAALGFYLT